MSNEQKQEITMQQSLFEVIPPSLAVKAMRDSGYKNTAFALSELLDNSIQAEASLVEVFCMEERTLVTERRRTRIAEIGVFDNGTGMDSDTLQQALQFGNGTRLNDRTGIGRFGMGLPNASISQCRRVDVWTWKAGPGNALHTFLDVDEIESGERRAVPTPQQLPVPKEWLDRSEEVGSSGTLVVWSNFDAHRLLWKKARSILTHTETLIGRMYRKFISRGDVEIRLVEYVDGTLASFDERAKANDPLYLINSTSTPAPFDSRPMFQKWDNEDMQFEVTYEDVKSTVYVRTSYATSDTIPPNGEDRGGTPYGKHAGKNIGVSIVRAGRELDLDSSWALAYDPRERWWGIEVEFSPELDEVFGVTNNKQAAVNFARMAKFDWKLEREGGETFIQFKERLAEEGDLRHHLIDIVNYINDQLKQLRKRIQDQTKGRRKSGSRHPAVEDTATTRWKKRAEYKPINSDGETLDDDTQLNLTANLEEKGYEPDVANEMASTARERDWKVLFVTADVDSSSFFNIEICPGGVVEVIFNSSHPVHEKLYRVLDTDISDLSPREMAEKIHNASDTFKIIFAAWARYEQEDLPSRDRIRDTRHDWGRMAKAFLDEENKE